MTWGLTGEFEPVVPRDRRVEVGERTLADGTVRERVDPEEVARAARALLDAGAESLAVVFINAYANPANERAALAAARAVWPNEHLVSSSEILPEIREFERTSTAVLNAYLQPPVGNYLSRLEDALGASGSDAQVLIVQSNGGVMTLDTARSRPVRTALSGPAAGVIAGARIAVEAGYPNVVTCDMGGTSFDVALVADGRSALAAQTAIDFGMVVRAPMIEISTIGAGGGSIAWVDRGGLLQVGPQSAGSDPGPACYGRSDRPTVTDANLVLGRINPDRPLGTGLARLDCAAAEQALARHVGEPLGLDAVAAADAVVRVANASMAGAIRLVSIERGHDPSDFVAMPFGGGGALHAGALIEEVGLRGALVPRHPGVTSALGCVMADMRHDFVQTVNALLGELDVGALDASLVQRAREGSELLETAGVVFERVEHRFELDMSYVGQTHTVDVTLAVEYDGSSTGLTRDLIEQAFLARYRQEYSRLLDGIAIRVLNLRVAAIGRRRGFDLRTLAPREGTDATPAGERTVWAGGTWHEAAVHERLPLPVGACIAGPAVLEQPDATVFVEPGHVARVDDFGNLLVTRGGDA